MLQLNERAQKFAEHLAQLGSLEHGEPEFSGNKEHVGENLAGGADAAKSVDMWYSEVDQYTPGSGFSMGTGHFTQASSIAKEFNIHFPIPWIDLIKFYLPACMEGHQEGRFRKGH